MMSTFFRCPDCGLPQDVRVTAYGWRATCPPCKARWTFIIGHDKAWRRERL